MSTYNVVIFVREGEDITPKKQEALCRDFVASSELAGAEVYVFCGKPLRRRQHGSWALTRRGQPELFAAVVAVRADDTFLAVAPRFIDHEPLGAASLGFSIDAVGGRMAFADPVDSSVLQFGAMQSMFANYNRTLQEFKVQPKERTRLPATGQIRFSGGMVPYGYELVNDGVVEPYLVPIPEQQAVINRMAELRNEGLSYRAIGSQLAEEGHFPPRRGAIWQPNSIKRALSRLGEEQLRETNEESNPHEARRTTGNS
tara:strand:+ start:537 stop:1307 length:771 start_codon:yes stop_codon:yes gene_type:complete